MSRLARPWRGPSCLPPHPADQTGRRCGQLHERGRSEAALGVPDSLTPGPRRHPGIGPAVHRSGKIAARARDFHRSFLVSTFHHGKPCPPDKPGHLTSDPATRRAQGLKSPHGHKHQARRGRAGKGRLLLVGVQVDGIATVAVRRWEFGPAHGVEENGRRLTSSCRGPRSDLPFECGPDELISTRPAMQNNWAGRRAFYPNFSRAVSAWHER
jgi:hypothetical protein